MLRSISVQDLNPHILCCLCGGYLVDATTIVECLHSFCRSCIVKYLQTSYHCPVCDAEVHKTKPLLHIRPDRPLQEIVYKLVPGLYQDQLKLRLEFEEKQKAESGLTLSEETETAKKSPHNSDINMQDPVCLTLEYFRRKRNWMEKQVFPTRYLRCPSAVTVKVLRKFLVMKFAIPTTHQVEIIRCDEILDGHLTVREISRIYGLYSKSFVDLQYAFLERTEDKTRTRLKSAEEVPRKKSKIGKKEARKTKVNLIKTELSSSGKEKLQPNGEVESVAAEFSSISTSQRDFSPTFPDTPPSCDSVPCTRQIESPA